MHKRKKPKAKAREAVIITEGEFQQLINATSNLQLKAILWIAYDTGMRRSEIAALRWQDIDFKTNTIHVHHAIKRTDMLHYHLDFHWANLKQIMGYEISR